MGTLQQRIDMKELDGKAIVITGSSRGIGAACARGAAARGAAIVVNGTDAEKTAEVVREIVGAGGRAVAEIGDVSDWQFAGRLIERCIAAFGRIDGLVNNAGLSRLDLIDEIDPDEFRRVIQINILGTAYCASHAIKAMKRQNSGSVVNITSGSQAGVQAMSAYTGSKGAIASMTYSWAMECADTGIRVNAVAPRAQTGMSAETIRYRTRKGMALLAPTPSAESNVAVIEYLLSDRSKDIRGQVFRIDGRQLSMMTHPALHHPSLVRDEWTFDAVSEAFERDFAKRQQPLGVAHLEAKVVK